MRLHQDILPNEELDDVFAPLQLLQDAYLASGRLVIVRSSRALDHELDRNVLHREVACGQDLALKHLHA